jgi:hypothetical protein
MRPTTSVLMRVMEYAILDLFSIFTTSKKMGAQVSLLPKKGKKQTPRMVETDGKISLCRHVSATDVLPARYFTNQAHHFFMVDCDSRTRFCSSSAFISRTLASTTCNHSSVQ